MKTSKFTRMQTWKLRLRRNKIKNFKAFLNLNEDELKQEGIFGLRNSMARGIKYKAYGIVTFIITVLYSLYIFSILAAEEHIYDSKSGAMAVEIVEIFFMALFFAEIAIYVIAFGPKLYFRDLFNF